MRYSIWHVLAACLIATFLTALTIAATGSC